MKILIHERIKEKRIENGLSQKNLADKLGIFQSNVSDWENAVSRPEYENLVALSKMFGVTADYLIGIENEDGTSCLDLKDLE